MVQISITHKRFSQNKYLIYFTLKVDKLTTEEADVFTQACQKCKLDFNEYPITAIVGQGEKQKRETSISILIYVNAPDIKQKTQLLLAEIEGQLPYLNDVFSQLHFKNASRYRLTANFTNIIRLIAQGVANFFTNSITMISRVVRLFAPQHNLVVNAELQDTIHISAAAFHSLARLPKVPFQPYLAHRKPIYNKSRQLIGYTLSIKNAYIEYADVGLFIEICRTFKLTFAQHSDFIEIHIALDQVILNVFDRWRQTVIEEIPRLERVLCHEMSELVVNDCRTKARSMFENGISQQHRFFCNLERKFIESNRHNDKDVQHAYVQLYGLNGN